MELTGARPESIRALRSDASTLRAGAAHGLLLVLLLLPLLLSPEVFSITALAAIAGWVVLNRFTVPRGAGHTVFLVAIIMLGLLRVDGAESHDVLRDAWFLGKSVLVYVAAYTFAWYTDDTRRLLRAFVIAGAVTAAAHVGEFLFDPELFEESLSEIRHQAGTGFLITCIAVAAIVGSWRAKLSLFERAWVAPAIVALCLCSIALSLSRTFIISLLILLAASAGGLELLRRRAYTVRRFVTALVTGAILLAVGGFAYRSAVTTDLGADLMAKLSRSLDEMSVRDYGNRRDISVNWRGYQAYRVWQDVLDGTLEQAALGRGYGAIIDMGVHAQSGDDYMRYFPALHNGYAYLLIKVGAVGCLLYVAFFVVVLRRGVHAARDDDDDGGRRVIGELAIGGALTLLATTIVVSGLMNKGSMNAGVVLIAAMIARDHRLRAEAEGERDERQPLVSPSPRVL